MIRFIQMTRYSNILLKIFNIVTFKNKLLIVERAPEPDDVYWENLGFFHSQKYNVRLWSWIIIMVLILASFLVLLILDRY